MSYLKLLSTDHRHARVLLDLMEEHMDRVRELRRDADFEVLRDIMIYMTRFADAVHHPRERPLLERIQERQAASLEAVRELAADHRALAEQGIALARDIQGVLAEDFVVRDAFCARAETYLTLYRDHMDREDRLFADALQYLNEDDWESIETAFEASADPLFGPVVADDLLQLRQLLYEREGEAAAPG